MGMTLQEENAFFKLQQRVLQLEQKLSALYDREIAAAEERGVRWALELNGHPFTTTTRDEYVKQICEDARKVDHAKKE